MDNTKTPVTLLLPFQEGRLSFFVFSAFTYKLQNLKINTCLWALHKHPRANYLQAIHSATPLFSTLQQSPLLQVWTFAAGKVVRQQHTWGAPTLSTARSVQQRTALPHTLLRTGEVSEMRAESRPGSMHGLPLTDQSGALEPTQEQPQYGLNTDNGILIPTHTRRKKDQNFTPIYKTL